MQFLSDRLSRRPFNLRGLPAGFIPAGPEELASSRLQAYLPLRQLAQLQPGAWHLLRSPDKHRKALAKREALEILKQVLRLRIRTVIFQKVYTGKAPRLMFLLRLLGRRIIYVECDKREDLSFARHVHTIIAPSLRLAQDLEKRSGVRAVQIPDPMEYWEPETLCTPWQPKAHYRALWVGNKRNWHQIAALKLALKKEGLTSLQIIGISNHPEADKPWSLDTIRSELRKADLGILPLTDDAWSTMKSHNRATLFMGLGIPLVVSDSDIYGDVVEDGETAFVFRSIEDLVRLPERLSTPGLVDSVRAKAMARAEQFTLQNVAQRWRAVVQER
jgi:glycosyltransferase involved in cell wall biosynthesis